jgi:hypothetical protein
MVPGKNVVSQMKFHDKRVRLCQQIEFFQNFHEVQILLHPRIVRNN